MNLLPRKYILRSKIESLCNNFVPYAVILGLFALSLVYYFLILLAVVAVVYYWKKISKKVLIIIIGTFLLCLGLRMIIYLVPIRITQAKVISVVQTKYGYSYSLLAHGLKYRASLATYYPPNTLLEITAKPYKLNLQIMPGGTNMLHTLLSQHIRASIKITSVSVIRLGKETLFLRYLNSYPKYASDFLKNLLGYSHYSNNYSFSFFKEVNLLRLLFFSGIHIIFLESLIKKILYYTSANPLIQQLTIILFELVLMIFLGVNLIIFRFLVNNMVKIALDVLCIKTSKLNMLALTFTLVTVLMPNYIFTNSFLICFLFAYIVILVKGHLFIKQKILRELLSPLIFYVFMLPILLLSQNRFNLLTLILAPFVLLGFKYFLMPLIIISVMFYPIGFLLNYIIKVGNFLTANVDASTFSFAIPRMSPLLIFIFYVLFYLLLIAKSRKKAIIFSVLLFLIFNFNLFKFYFNPISKMYFFAVGQGNSSLLIDGVTKKTLVVDAFGQCLEAYDSLGIRSLDVVILTHSDLDHIGDYNRIANYIKIKKLYLSNYDTYDLIVQRNKVTYELNKTYQIGKISYTFLGPLKDYRSKNNNSLITKVNFLNTSILYTGDIDKLVEQGLANQYSTNLQSDILMVSHHGSSYGTSDNFLNLVAPQNAIISCGEHNRYMHPGRDVISKLKKRNINYYITYQDSTLINFGLTKFNKKMYKYKIINSIIN